MWRILFQTENYSLCVCGSVPVPVSVCVAAYAYVLIEIAHGTIYCLHSFYFIIQLRFKIMYKWEDGGRGGESDWTESVCTEVCILNKLYFTIIMKYIDILYVRGRYASICILKC